MGWLDKYQNGKQIPVSERGLWDNPDEPVIVPTESGNITMKADPKTGKEIEGPVFAIDNTGYTQIMYPGGEYQFPSNMVYEIPMAQAGGDISIPDLSNKDWLSKYQDGAQVPREKQLGPRAEYLPKQEFVAKPNLPDPSIKQFTPEEIAVQQGYKLKQVPGGSGSMQYVYTHPVTGQIFEPESTRKQQTEIADIARSNNVDPVGMAILAASGATPLIRTAASALPYLNAPLTVGSTAIPGVTAGNILGAAGAANSVNQIVNPNSDLRTNPNAVNILETGLGFVGLPYKTAAASVMDDFTQAGKYLTEQTPLKNAYKYNPWAFKPNPEAYYRGVGKKGIKDALESRVIKSRDQDLFPSPYFVRPNEFETALYYNPDALIEAKGIDVSQVKNIEPNQIIFKNKDAGAVPLNPEYVNEVYLGNITPGFKSSQLEHLSIDNPNIRLLQKDWLRGYKGIDTPKQLPSSSNIPILKRNVIYPSPNKPLPNYMEPFLGKVKKPISKDEKIFRSSFTPETRAKMEANDWIYFDANGNIISPNQYLGDIEFKKGGWLDDYK